MYNLILFPLSNPHSNSPTVWCVCFQAIRLLAKRATADEGPHTTGITTFASSSSSFAPRLKKKQIQLLWMFMLGKSHIRPKQNKKKNEGLRPVWTNPDLNIDTNLCEPTQIRLNHLPNLNNEPRFVWLPIWFLWWFWGGYGRRRENGGGRDVRWRRRHGGGWSKEVARKSTEWGCKN